MILRIDARRFTDFAHLHAALDEAFGFPKGYGKNVDALVDCLTYLDDLKAGMCRIQVFPGQLVLLVLEHMSDLNKVQMTHARTLIDAVNFVNWRRLESGQPPVLALAHEQA